MEPFSFLHCADIHLDSPLQGLPIRDDATTSKHAQNVRDATRIAFQNMIAEAISNGVSFVILAGDVFDGSRIDTKTGFFFVEQLRKLREADIHVYLVWGNHDAECLFAKELALDNEFVHVFPSEEASSIQVEGLPNVVIHGQSYPTRDVKENLAAKYPAPHKDAFNIGVLHCNVGNVSEHESYAPCSLNQLKNHGYQYWALGHVHSHEVLSDSSSVHVVYPGNLQGRHIRETGSKGAILVHVENNIVQNLRFVDCSCVHWYHLTTQADERFNTVDEFLDQVAAEISEVSEYANTQVVRVTLQGSTALHEDLHFMEDIGEVNLVDSLEFRVRSEKSNVFIERVDLRTQPLHDNLLASMDDTELSELFRLLGDVDIQSAAPDLQKELKKFRDAIPNEVLRSSQDPTLSLLRDEDYVGLLTQSSRTLGTLLSREDD